MAASANILEMAFRTHDDKKRILSISPCKINVTDTQVRAAGAALIENSDALVWNPAELLGAKIVQRMTIELF